MENILYKKNKFKLITINLSKLIFYFTFYSFIGFCFESLFGIATKGVLESRKSFLFGPFCAIYGIGAIIMILTLKPLKNHHFFLFIASMLIGALTEYLMSFICEIFFHFKWWDYSDYFLNIQGRTCLFYMVIWGFLGVALVKYVNPKLEKGFLNMKKRIPSKIFFFILLGISLFFIIDISLTIFALKYFFAKISVDYSIPQTNYSAQKLEAYPNLTILDKTHLLKTFPNLRIAGNYMDNVFVDSLYSIPETYYFKLFDIKNNEP